MVYICKFVENNTIYNASVMHDDLVGWVTGFVL